MFNKNRSKISSHKYYTLYLAALVKKLNLKDYVVYEENRKYDWVYFGTYFYGILKNNIKGLYIYEYGWNYGVEGITLVIRNKQTKEYGELMAEIDKEERDKRIQSIYYTHKNMILNKWETDASSYWQFGKNKYNKISYIRLGYENLYPKEHISMMLGIFELLDIIEKEKIEMKKYIEKQKFKVVA